jgi:hypothetical protein
MVDYTEMGLFQRFNYERKDGKPLDDGELLFTFRYDKADAWGAICRKHLLAFARDIEEAGYKPLADDLREKIRSVRLRIEQSKAAPGSIVDKTAPVDTAIDDA